MYSKVLFCIIKLAERTLAVVNIECERMYNRTHEKADKLGAEASKIVASVPGEHARIDAVAEAAKRRASNTAYEKAANLKDKADALREKAGNYFM